MSNTSSYLSIGILIFVYLLGAVTGPALLNDLYDYLRGKIVSVFGSSLVITKHNIVTITNNTTHYIISIDFTKPVRVTAIMPLDTNSITVPIDENSKLLITRGDNQLKIDLIENITKP